jgi:hypothetical protein
MRVPVRVLALTSLAFAAAACAARRSAPAATAWAQPVAGPLTIGQAAPAEPLGCPIYGGDDRPDYDAQGLQCIVQWIRQAQDYLASGGKPTKYTNAATLDQYRGDARALQARLDAFVSGARWEAVALPRPPAAAPAAQTGSGSSQQAFLSGMVYFQKGDYISARAQWTLAVKLDAANADAKSGLARLDALEGR